MAEAPASVLAQTLSLPQTSSHRHPVGQVQQESGLSRAAFYKRMAQAGVKAIRVGQNSFLEREHLEALRALEEHIQAGGKPEAFPGRLQTSPEMALAPAGRVPLRGVNPEARLP